MTLLRCTIASSLLASVLVGAPRFAQAQEFKVDVSTRPVYSSQRADGDFKVGPEYADAPELTVKPGVPKGHVVRFKMQSTDSRLYPGISKLTPGEIVPYERGVSVYIPAGYKAGTETPFFVSQDSMGVNLLPRILDSMIAARRLPSMVGIFIDSGGSDSRGSERGWEYDTLSGQYAEFIETEVLPKIAADYQIVFTRDADGRMVMGGSSGGICAFTMAWFHPEWYHRVLSYSGTFVNQQWPPIAPALHGGWDYHEHIIPESRRKPIRIWMQVGENDLGSNNAELSYHNWVMANERMAKVLKAKGYHYQYVYSQGAKHVDGRVVKQTLPQALEYVWAGYHPKG